MQQAGTTSRARPADRRGELVDAAATLFVEQGVAATTVAQVAERAGVAKGTVYLYFATKAHLVAGLRERLTDGWIAVVVRGFEDVDRGDDYWSTVEAVIAETVDYWLAHRRTAACIESGDTAEAADLVAAQDQRCVDLVDQAIRMGVERGEVQVADTALAAQVLFHGLYGATHHVIVDEARPDLDRDRLVAACIEAVRRLLGAP